MRDNFHINRLVGPECFYGKRRIKESAKNLYSIIKKIEMVLGPEDRGIDVDALFRNLSPSETLFMSSNVLSQTSMERFLEMCYPAVLYWRKSLLGNTPRNYYFPRELSNALSKAKASLKQKPENFKSTIAYFAYPDEHFRLIKRSYSGAYIVTSSKKDYPSFGFEGKHYGHIRMSLVKNNGTIGATACLPLVEGQELEDVICDQENFEGDINVHLESGMVENYVRTIVNSYLYISTSSLNIDHLRPELSLTKSEKRERRDKKNYCTVPMELVNWNFGK